MGGLQEGSEQEISPITTNEDVGKQEEGVTAHVPYKVAAE